MPHPPTPAPTKGMVYRNPTRQTVCPYVWLAQRLHNKSTNTDESVKVFFCFFSVRLLSVLRGHSYFHLRHNGQ